MPLGASFDVSKVHTGPVSVSVCLFLSLCLLLSLLTYLPPACLSICRFMVTVPVSFLENDSQPSCL